MLYANICGRHRVLYTPRVLLRGTSSDLSSKVKLDVVVVARFRGCGSQIVLASDSISPGVVKDVDLVSMTAEAGGGIFLSGWMLSAEYGIGMATT
jgi:ribulose 1,5-bisphosphate synthetase/thiazole synthase